MNRLQQNLERIIAARHHDPFTVLGIHDESDQSYLTVYRPHADSVWVTVEGQRTEMKQIGSSGLFRIEGDATSWGRHPVLVERSGDWEQHFIDPYTFWPQVSEEWLNGFHLQECFDAYRLMGAHPWQIDNIDGTLFVVWAPNAERVSVVGDFNRWDGRVNPMRSRGQSGIWELFIPEFEDGALYKFEIRNRDTGEVTIKSDPYGRFFEVRPNSASRYCAPAHYQWQDDLWLQRRSKADWLHSPQSIYEVHLGSWRRQDNGDFLSYRELAEQLVSYVKEMGFTHIELLPVTEFPFDGSWGYQVTGFFAPTSRFGDINDFKYFVDHCHCNGIGVILDWVPAHFPRDAHGLARFDGTCLYEHDDPRRGEHKDWGTLIFNYGRNEVRNFLFSSAYFWLEEFHVDGLRVDAVASMLYLDYSRQAGEWTPNQYGGNENLEAIHFIRRTNEKVHQDFPGVLMMAEESTAWPQVSRPVYLGGLGFSMKWNMGWMNDTLRYVKHDPVHRPFHHENLTFSLLYAFSENFVLPLSHDEVVHGKYSLLEKMPGDGWQQFANLRLLFTYMYTHPGKKLLFMGGEFGQGREWCHDRALDWHLLEHDWQRGVQSVVRDLNGHYQKLPALHRYDFEERGFQWIDCHDSSQSVISFLRRSEQGYVIVVLNFTPVVREHYRIGVPEGVQYQEIFNSDSIYYGGSNISNGTAIQAEPDAHMNQPCSITLTLPPLAGIILSPA
ncbi:1,4-alpha-glucan branching protein GlgB [Ketobacter sp.]|uniref:1,4-alpha-glucan branching protein GlgB n=1 Tax=Ketobacter sp. TaxID=2083498 RepID=UPI000F211058|nr:1,4-alpha-glucan branching protein GlgB [Ketobacter sp.]RLU01534.1 MAG: 1,4-alpha-glucan branching protein GlgB [Ketobacter sp.]